MSKNKYAIYSCQRTRTVSKEYIEQHRKMCEALSKELKQPKGSSCIIKGASV